MVKRIGIITIVKVNNYGAELQAFALQKKLELMGYQSEIIDYLYYKNPLHEKSRRSQPWISIGFVNRIKEWLYPVYYSFRTRPYREAKLARERRFEGFHRSFTRFSKGCFEKIDALFSADLIYDVYIVGSDQVWNPYTNTSLDPYFLRFAPEGACKISYASSFGVSQVPDATKAFYAKGFDGFRAVSVREDSAVALVRQLSGMEATHVLDPTLLLSMEDWRAYSTKPNIEGGYILMYILASSPMSSRIAKKLSSDLGLPIVRICREAVGEGDSGFLDITDAGPSEFLGWVMNASMMITNSFHGTAFSVNFNIPFYVIVPGHKANNSRQESLLRLLNLSSRILREGGDVKLEDPTEIDFSKPNELLAAEIEKSVSFLRDSIEG